MRDGAEYEALLAGADPAGLSPRELDDDATISINYTSGTTGRPKGVMYTYRGAYLNALSEAFHAGLRPESVLSVDPADVPLQRLVLSVGGQRGRGDPRLPAQGRPGHDQRRRSATRA